MIDFFVLGRLDLARRDAPGDPIRMRPKPAALLARLVLYQPRGWQRRGSLLGMFWPESDERRARLSLRNALHVLRGDLGDDVLLARGDDEIMVNPERLSCDALAFEDAFDAGRLEDALALYRGPLLDGWLASDAPDFHIWLDERREGLRRRAVSAAVALADRCDAAGRADEFSSWAQRALELSPYDETLIRRALRSFEQRGDRGGALVLYDQWATRLRADIESEPSPETAALAERLRASNAAPAPPATPRQIPVPVDEPPSPRSPPAQARWFDTPTLEISNTAAPRRTRPRRMVVASAIAATLALGVVVTANRGLRSATPAAKPSDATAVLPFTVTGDGPTKELATRIAALVGAGFGESGPLRGIDGRVLERRNADQTGSGLGRAKELAISLGAGEFVVGTAVVDHGILQLQASLYDGRRDTIPLGRAAAVGPLDSAGSVAQRLAFDLIAVRVGGVPVASLGTTSIEALRAYFDGERQMFASRYADAVDAYTRAIAADTQFARAYLRLAYAGGFAPNSGYAYDAAERARALADRLTPVDRTLLHAWRRQHAGDVVGSIASYEEALSMDARSAEAWLQLADVRFHWGPTFGIPASAAAEAFRRISALVPNSAASLIHLARLEARDAPNGGGFDTLARAARALDLTATEDLELRVLAAIVTGAPRDRDAVVADAGALGAVTERTMLLASVPFPDTVVSTALARRLAANSDTASRMIGFLHLAQIAASHGRRRDALRIAHEMAALAPDRAIELHAWLLMLPYWPANDVERRAVRDSISRLATGSFATHDAQPFEDVAATTIYGPRKHYVDGVLSLLIGDTARTAADIAALGRWSGHELENAHAAEYRRALVAEQAMHRTPATAIAAFPAPGLPAEAMYPDVVNFSIGRSRFLRAESLAAAGRTTEALVWYETFPDPKGFDVWFLPAALARRAAIYAQMGRTADAENAAARATAFWRGADPEMKRRLTDSGR